MNYTAYPNKKAVPSRLTRKQQRRNVFQTNRKMAKVARKARRLAKKEA